MIDDLLADDEHMTLPPGRLHEEDDACAWCSIGRHEFCSATAAAYAPCACCE